MSPGHDRFYKKSQAKFLEFRGRSETGREEFAIFHADTKFPLDSLCH